MKEESCSGAHRGWGRRKCELFSSPSSRVAGRSLSKVGRSVPFPDGDSNVHTLVGIQEAVDVKMEEQQREERMFQRRLPACLRRGTRSGQRKKSVRSRTYVHT